MGNVNDRTTKWLVRYKLRSMKCSNACLNFKAVSAYSKV